MSGASGSGWEVRDVGPDEDILDDLICHTAKATKAGSGGGVPKARGAEASTGSAGASGRAARVGKGAAGQAEEKGPR